MQPRTQFVQRLASERPRLLSKLPAFGVSEDNAPPTEARAEHAVLGFQIVDSRRLLPLQPTGDTISRNCRRVVEAAIETNVGC